MQSIPVSSCNNIWVRTLKTVNTSKQELFKTPIAAQGQQQGGPRKKKLIARKTDEGKEKEKFHLLMGCAKIVGYNERKDENKLLELDWNINKVIFP